MARKSDYLQQVDQTIGAIIYSLRLAKGLAREQLAKAIGVTHQQLQKYEKGVNRMSTGRLVLIAKALGESVSYFYKDLDLSSEPTITQHQRICIEISRNFMQIRDPKHQDAVNTLVKSLSKESA